MNKKILLSIVIIAIIMGVVTCVYVIGKEDTGEQQEVEEQTEISEKVTDECTEEYEAMQTEETEATNAEEEKVSPNAVITFERYYKQCEHTISRYEEIEEELVNATQEEVQAEYESWEIKEFNADNIILYKEYEGECGEHYMLRDVNGKLNIYEIATNGDEILIEETDIATEYLTETDMIDIENGIIVYGKENLNKLLEDFE